MDIHHTIYNYTIRGFISPYRFMVGLFILLLFFLAVTTNPAGAKTIQVGPGQDLQAIIDSSENSDVIALAPGLYEGSITIGKSITLQALKSHKAILDGETSGSTIIVTAPDVTITGLTIRNSGTVVANEDAGIYMDISATGGRIIDNVIVDNLFGISLHGSKTVLVSGNHIKGSFNPQLSERGDGIRMWNVFDSIIENNEIEKGRDGIFITVSSRNILRDNTMHDLRFAIHYMYANDNRVEGNISYHNHIGYALMYSRKLQVDNNLSLNDRDHGVMFNFAHKSVITNNIVKGTDDKCTFLYNATGNIITGNYFEGCQIGIHYTAGSKDNRIYNNAFINNRHQVKYVGSRYQEWSEDGRGNYWSDHTGIDINGDAIADFVYRPNSITDQIIWTVPSAKLLLASPAMRLLEWAHGQFPALYPGGITDSHPLMAYKTPSKLTALEEKLQL